MYILTNKKNMRDDEVILVDIKQFRAISPEEIEVKDDKGILSLDNVIKVRFDPPHGELHFRSGKQRDERKYQR